MDKTYYASWNRRDQLNEIDGPSAIAQLFLVPGAYIVSLLGKNGEEFLGKTEVLVANTKLDASTERLSINLAGPGWARTAV